MLPVSLALGASHRHHHLASHSATRFFFSLVSVVVIAEYTTRGIIYLFAFGGTNPSTTILPPKKHRWLYLFHPSSPSWFSGTHDTRMCYDCWCYACNIYSTSIIRVSLCIAVLLLVLMLTPSLRTSPDFFISLAGIHLMRRCAQRR